MVKPSEMSPACSALMAELVRKTFDWQEVAAFEGDASVSAALLGLPFEHIFFTGSLAIGKVVMCQRAPSLFIRSALPIIFGGFSKADGLLSQKIDQCRYQRPVGGRMG